LNGGEISIPTKNGERKTYSFNISTEDKTPGGFQCLPVNAIRSNINKTTNDSSCVSSIVPSNRLSIQNSHSKVSIVNNVNTKQKTKSNSSSINSTNIQH
ncbi:unnamed protein product, partial [Rotaria sordida]